MKGYKTLLFNLSAGLVAGAEATDMTALLTAPQMGWYALFITIVNTILRFYTDTKAMESK